MPLQDALQEELRVSDKFCTDKERDSMNILMLISNGFEEVEALTVVDLLRRGGVKVNMCSMTGDSVLHGSHGIDVIANSVWKNDEFDFDEYDGVVLPGGLPNAHTLRDDERVIDIVKHFALQNKITAAICAAPCVLERAGLLKGKEATSYPGCIDEKQCNYQEIPTVVCDNVVTSRGVGTAIDFALSLLRVLKGPDVAADISEAILYR